jgi:hypothetical protein
MLRRARIHVPIRVHTLNFRRLSATRIIVRIRTLVALRPRTMAVVAVASSI